MNKLQACHPNVILVEKSTSRFAMEKILQMGVTLVLDMKLNRLERIARCTGSPILSSDLTIDQELSHCNSLYFEKFVEDHAIVSEGGKKPSMTLMFLEGCPRPLGCTILLKGSQAEELKKIKNVVQCAVVMAYHFLLETYFLVNQQAMFSTIDFGKGADIMSSNEQSTLVEFENSRFGEPTLGFFSADGVLVPISSDGDKESSCVQEPASHDIPVSRLQEEEACDVTEFTAKYADIASPYELHGKVSHTIQLVADNTSTNCSEPHIITPALPKSSYQAIENASNVSPVTFENMSTYIDLREPVAEAQTAVSVTVSPTEEPAEFNNLVAKNKEKESILNDSQPAFTGESKGPGDDVNESFRGRDEISNVLDSESILVLMSSRNALKGTICKQSTFSHIKFYKNFDVPLGNFLRDNLFNQAVNCETCGLNSEAHFYYYAHHSKQLTIRVKRIGNKELSSKGSDEELWMWSRCSKCKPDKEKATKRVLVSSTAWCLSFGKFLELSFSSYSSFNRLASCGHSFQKDFLYFFGLGSMVSMFQYSRVAIYTVSVPALKLEFNSSIDKDWLQPEISTVYTTGLVLFNELEKYLKKIESRFTGWNLVLNGLSKGFSDIVDMLKLERSEFEDNFKNMNEDSHDTVYKLLSLNRLRWEILLEACVWDRRLKSLLSSSTWSHSAISIDGVARRPTGLMEDVWPGEVTEGSKTVAETMERQMLLVESRSEREGELAQKMVDKTMIEQLDSEKKLSDGAVADTVKEVERQTELNNEGAEEVGVQKGDDDLHDVMIEGTEVIAHGDYRESENCNDTKVEIEMVAEAENLSVKESSNEGILLGSGDQKLKSLPIVEENTQSPPSRDSISISSSCLESNGSTDYPSHVHSDGESTQQDNVSLSGQLSEDSNICIKADKENSSCSTDGEVPERLTSPLLKLDTPWWNPFKQTREECMEDLLEGRPSKFGHLPKFELLHSPEFLPTVSQVIIEEGSRLHIPLRDGDFILSDFDGEISSSVTCALALVEVSSPPETNTDENSLLKRAVSEPWPLSSLHDPDFFHSSSSMTFTEAHLSHIHGQNRMDSAISYGRFYNEVTLGIEKYPVKGKYSVVIIYPNEFRSLRDRCCPSELDYIASLSRCKIWDAKGGKSKSVFSKTPDNRLIVKEIKKTEFDSFMKFASAYFQHMKESVDSGNQTCLGKILGIYQITIRNPKSGKETKHDLMVQENLSFGRNITRQYDLKGALHARFTDTADGAGDVLLDQNFVNDMNTCPLYVGQKSKRLLQRAVWNDTTFLKNIGVMDYSLLVGVDRHRRELVCGIIDYLRQYTWDKQFETWVKSSLVVPKNVLPTIISPHEYKKRFRKFMDTHFLTVPDHWCSQRSSNPCQLCGVKVHDSSVAKLEKREEELIGVQTHN